MRRFLKKLTVVYIQKSLTFEHTAQTLNLYNLHSFFNVGLTHCFFFSEYSILTHTHTQKERGEKDFKKTNSSVYLKGPNELMSVCNK